jgi:hypothetical protein
LKRNASSITDAIGTAGAKRTTNEGNRINSANAWKAGGAFGYCTACPARPTDARSLPRIRWNTISGTNAIRRASAGSAASRNPCSRTNACT